MAVAAVRECGTAAEWQGAVPRRVRRRAEQAHDGLAAG